MDLQAVWNEVASSKNVNPAAVQKHLETIQARKAAGIGILPIVHCDVMGTLFNREANAINQPLLDLLHRLKDSGREIKIISADAEEARRYMGEISIAKIVNKAGDEMTADLTVDGKMCELLIDDRPQLARFYASRLHPDELIR